MGTIHSAVKKQDLQAVQKFLKKGVNVNQKDKAKNVPLNYAVEKGNLVMVELLLTSGASPNIVDESKPSILNYAIENGDLQLVKLLLNYDADVNSACPITPLSCAINHGNVEIVNILIESGAEVNIESVALSNEQRPSNKSTMDYNCSSPLHLAVLKNALSIVSILVEKGANLNFNDDCQMHPLSHAIEMKNLHMVQMLTNHIKNSDLKQDVVLNNPLHVVVNVLRVRFQWTHPYDDSWMYLSEEIVNLLLQNEAEINSSLNPGKKAPLHCNIEKQFEKLAALLMRKFGDASEENDLPINLDLKTNVFEFILLCEEDCFNNESELESIFERHIIRIQALNISGEMELEGKKNEYLRRCKAEIDLLKTRKMSFDSTETLYDILIKPSEWLFEKLNTDKFLKQTLRNTFTTKLYPVYGIILSYRISKCLRKIPLLDKSYNRIGFLEKSYIWS